MEKEENFKKRNGKKVRKMKNKHAGQKLKQLLAAGLSFSMVFSGVLPAAAAGTETQKRTVAGTPVTEEELKEALAQDAALYPEGGFEFLETQISGEERYKEAAYNRPQRRHGSNSFRGVQGSGCICHIR